VGFHVGEWQFETKGFQAFSPFKKTFDCRVGAKGNEFHMAIGGAAIAVPLAPRIGPPIDEATLSKAGDNQMTVRENAGGFEASPGRLKN
jgi:hypothetical protein